MLAVELADIERENFDGLLAKHQIRQYFLSSINYTTYKVLLKHKCLPKKTEASACQRRLRQLQWCG